MAAAVQVDLHHAVKILELHAGEFTGHADAGAVDDHIRYTSFGGGLGDGFEHLLAVRHVQLVARHALRGRFARRLDRAMGGVGRIEIEYHDMSTQGCQSLAGFQSDTAGAARNIDGLSRKVFHEDVPKC